MKKNLILPIVGFSLGLILLFSCTGGKVNSDNTSMLIGIASVNYTPSVGINLYGNYRGTDYASRGVHDSLFAKAMVVSNLKGEKIAMLTIDICYVSNTTANMIRTIISSQTDIKAGNIMVHATHTHSGPPSDLNSPEAKAYLSKAASAVILANQRLKPGNLFVGSAKEDRISFNRRLKCKDGSTHMCWEKLEPDFVIGPLGPVDPEIITLSVEQDGKPIGAIVNFGCHPTTLTGNNWLFSADYPGYMVEAMLKAKGKDFLPLFFNGPCGNVTQVDYRAGFIDTYQECQRIGYILGVGALDAVRSQQKVEGTIVAASHEMVPIKRMTITSEQYEWAKAIMGKVKKEGMPPLQADGIPDAMFASQWIEMYNTQNVIDSLEVTVFRLGDVAVVALPGEIFSEFGLDIKSRSPFKKTIVMALTNYQDYYFPTKMSFTQGPKGFTPMITGYETTPGSTRHDIGAGEKLAESAIKQLHMLKKTAR